MIDFNKINKHIEYVDEYLDKEKPTVYDLTRIQVRPNKPAPVRIHDGDQDGKFWNAKERTRRHPDPEQHMNPTAISKSTPATPQEANKFLSSSVEKMRRMNANNGLLTNFNNKIKNLKINSGDKSRDERIKSELETHANALNRLINNGKMDAEQYVKALRKISTKMNERYDGLDMAGIIKSTFPLPKSYTSKVNLRDGINQPENSMDENSNQQTNKKQSDGNLNPVAHLNKGKSLVSIPNTNITSMGSKIKSPETTEVPTASVPMI